MFSFQRRKAIEVQRLWRLRSGIGVGLEPRRFNAVACCEAKNYSGSTLTQTNGGSVPSQINDGFVSRRRDCWLRGGVRWRSDGMTRLRPRRLYKPCDGASGERQMGMRWSCWAKWDRVGSSVGLA